MGTKSRVVLFAATCLLIPALALPAAEPDTWRDYLTTAPGAADDDGFQKALRSIDDDTLASLVEKYALDEVKLTDPLRAAFIKAAFAQSSRPDAPEGPGPANDACAAALAVTDGTTPFDLTGATTDGPQEPACAFPFGAPDNLGANQDIWYTYTATCTGDVFVDTCGSGSIDTRIIVYSSTDCLNLGVPVECNDDHGNTTEADTGLPCPGTFEASLSFPAAAGTPYLIRVGSFSTSGTIGGADDLNISCVVGSVCNDGTCDGNEDSCNCPTDCGPPDATETSCTDGMDNDCDTFIDCADPDCSANPACASNDDCNTAIDITANINGAPIFGENLTATSDNQVTCGTSPVNQAVWYSVVGNGNTLTVETCGAGTDFDTKIQVWCSDCAALNCVDGNDDFCGLQSQVSWCSEVGVTYRFAVGGFGTTSGNFELAITDDATPCPNPPGCGSCGDGSCDPNEDSCSCPADCGSPDPFETSCTDGIDNDCDLLIDCADTVDCPPGSGEVDCLDGIDNDCDGFTDCTDTECATTPACVSTNDDCTAAVPLGTPPSGGMVSVISHNNGATDDATAACGTTDGGTGVWYTVIGTGNTLTATTCNPGSDFDTKLTVFCAGCTNLNCVDGNDDTAGAPPECDLGGLNRFSTVSWCSGPGVEYHIMVHGFAGATGNFELTVSDDATPCPNPPACGVCGNTMCESGEDPCNCPTDCGPPDAVETSCTDGMDNDCDTLIDCDDDDCVNDPACIAIPTVSQWGMIVMGMMLFVIATIVIRHRSLPTPST